MLVGDLAQKLARAVARMAACGQGSVVDRLGVLLDHTPIVGIELRFEQLAQTLPGVAQLLEDRQGRLDHDLDQVAVADGGLRHGLFDGEPAGEAVAGRVPAGDFLEQSEERALMTVLHALEVPAHVAGAPGLVADELGDIVPVLVIRIDHDHGVVGGAAAKRPGARIEHAVALGDKLVVKLLLRVIGVVAHEELPAHRLVLRRHRVPCRHLVVLRHAVGIGGHRPAAFERQRIAARLEQQHLVPGLCEPGGNRAAAGARPHHDVLILRCVGHRVLPLDLMRSCCGEPSRITTGPGLDETLG